MATSTKQWLRHALAAASLAAAGVPLVAEALPLVGATAPEGAAVVDVDDRALRLEQLRGKPVLVVYEDKDSAKLNEALKAELDQLMQKRPELRRVQVVAVADVSEYDFWPAKGAVKDAIRDEQKKAKTTIYLDWSGDFRGKLALDKSTSNVVLFDGQGRFTFVRAGKLEARDRAALVEAMSALANR